MKKIRLCNDKKINEKNLLELINSCVKEKWKNSDLWEKSQQLMTQWSIQNKIDYYKDIEEYLLQRDHNITLFDLESAINQLDLTWLIDLETITDKDIEKY